MTGTLHPKHPLGVTGNEIQVGFIPEKGTPDDLFIMRRQQEEYHAKVRKMHMCFAHQEKAFYRVPSKVLEWMMRKK